MPSSVAWDSVRGYLVCLCRRGTADSEPNVPSAARIVAASATHVAIVWDVHSGEDMTMRIMAVSSVRDFEEPT